MLSLGCLVVDSVVTATLCIHCLLLLCRFGCCLSLFCFGLWFECWRFAACELFVLITSWLVVSRECGL